MLPFMAEELDTILWTLLEKFIKKSVLEEATTAAKRSKIDVLKKENILSPKKVDVGFACKILLQEAQAKKKASPLQVLEFQNERIVLLQKLTNKLLECCPLQYAIVRQLTCMDPRYMAKNPDSAISKCSGLLQQLISNELVSPDSSDTFLQQYKAFITEVMMNLLPTTQNKVLTLSCMGAPERSQSIPNCGKLSKCCLYFPMVSHVLKEVL